jgi:hypothetical protein
MPKLPEQQKERDFELVDKASLNRGTIDNSKPYIRSYHRKFPLKLIVVLMGLALMLVAIYSAVSRLYPMLIKKAPEAIVVPSKSSNELFNADEIKFTSDDLKEKFMKNLDLASKELDKEKSFKYLDADFEILYEMYRSTNLSEYTIQMEKMKKDMNKNYPIQYQKYLGRYQYVCSDDGCWEAHDVGKPAEIVEIRKALYKVEGINNDIKSIVVMAIDTGLLSTDKKVQMEAFTAVFKVLSEEYNRSKNVEVKNIYLKLNDYVVKNYPDIKIPDDAKIGN